MKFKSLLFVLGFIPAMVFAQGAPKIEPPVVAETPSKEIPSANGGDAKPAAASVEIKPTPEPAEAAATTDHLGPPGLKSKYGVDYFTTF